MRSEPTTVAEYLQSLPSDRRIALEAVRATIRARLPEGYEEAFDWGMISYRVPLRVYPDTYNKRPLLYAGLASQKNHMAVYLNGIYADSALRDRFEAAYRSTGKRYDVGKSCVRFRRLDDLPLDVLGDAIAAVPLEQFVARARAAGSARRTKG